jgi:uncharacterized protein YjbJ (UPF0337 family)
LNKDRVKGIIDDVAGSAKRKAGELTDNPKLQVEGMIQQAKGKVQNAWGKAKDAIHDSAADTQAHRNSGVDLVSENAATGADRSHPKKTEGRI